MYMMPRDEGEGRNVLYGDNELHSAESLMNHDRPLTPKMISSLMHVDASLLNVSLHQEEVERKESGGALYVMGVLVLSVILAGAIGTAFLYIHQIGPFYDSSRERV
jgi:hypothetical protein